MNWPPPPCLKGFARTTLTGLAALALCGCLPIPHKYSAVPQFSGEVRDARSGEPVAGAELRVTDPVTERTSIAGTHADGSFTIERRRAWTCCLWFMGDWMPQWEVTVRHDDYGTHKLEVGRMQAGSHLPQPVRLVIDLTPQGATEVFGQSVLKPDPAPGPH